MSKERAKLFHDRMILRKEFTPDMKVFLYDSRLHLFPRKLRPRWTGPFVVTHVLLYSVVKIQDLASGAKQKVQSQILKHFLELPTEEDVECLMLHEPPSDY